MIGSMTERIVNTLALAYEELMGETWTVERGEPVDFDGDERDQIKFPTIAIIPGNEEREDSKKIISETLLDNGKWRVLWRREILTLPLQVHIYTKTKEDRIAAAGSFEGIFYTMTERGRPDDLELVIPDYYGVKVRFIPGNKLTTDARSGDSGYASAMLRVSAHTISVQSHDVASRQITTQVTGE